MYSKTSANGIDWTSGLGTAVPSQRGGPYLLGLQDARLLGTSNNHQVSMSDDEGKSWHLVALAFEGGPEAAFFSSV